MLYVVASAEVAASSVNCPVGVVPRSILNPVSLGELSNQDNEMLVLEAEVATRLEGAAGGVVVLSVVAMATFEKAEFPTLLLALARTR